MRVIQIHNRHVQFGGMEVLFDSICDILTSKGHQVLKLERDNANIVGITGKLKAFRDMLHSPDAKSEMKRCIEQFKPDIVHVHNLWPQFSTSVLDACREANVPVVMAVQDYKFTCATAQHLRDGKICEKCITGGNKWCAIHNCRGNRVWSVAYAARNTYFQKLNKIKGNVTLYLASSDFAKHQIIKGGYPASRTFVASNFTSFPIDMYPRAVGDYIGYIGRISPEKGLPILIEAARRTGIPVKIAGNHKQMPELLEGLPANVEFVGLVSRADMPEFVRNARCTVVPSIWYEGKPVVAMEALGLGTPVIVSDIGGLAEIPIEGQTGFKVPVGDVEGFAGKMKLLWDDPGLAMKMGCAAIEQCRREYTQEVFYGHLMRAYECAKSWPKPWEQLEVAA